MPRSVQPLPSLTPRYHIPLVPSQARCNPRGSAASHASARWQQELKAEAGIGLLIMRFQTLFLAQEFDGIQDQQEEHQPSKVRCTNQACCCVALALLILIRCRLANIKKNQKKKSAKGQAKESPFLSNKVSIAIPHPPPNSQYSFCFSAPIIKI